MNSQSQFLKMNKRYHLRHGYTTVFFFRKMDNFPFERNVSSVINHFKKTLNVSFFLSKSLKKSKLSFGYIKLSFGKIEIVIR